MAHDLQYRRQTRGETTKDGKRVAASAGRLFEGGKVSGWKQRINQMAVAYPERFDRYL